MTSHLCIHRCMSMVRKQVYIERRQDEMLKELSARLGLSEAALIRRGIDRCLQAERGPQPDLDLWDAEMEYMRGRLKQVAPGEREWTRDDLYDR